MFRGMFIFFQAAVVAFQLERHTFSPFSSDRCRSYKTHTTKEWPINTENWPEFFACVHKGRVWVLLKKGQQLNTSELVMTGTLRWGPSDRPPSINTRTWFCTQDLQSTTHSFYCYDIQEADEPRTRSIYSIRLAFLFLNMNERKNR
jgi:hypothetical protein